MVSSTGSRSMQIPLNGNIPQGKLHKLLAKPCSTSLKSLEPLTNFSLHLVEYENSMQTQLDEN